MCLENNNTLIIGNTYLYDHKVLEIATSWRLSFVRTEQCYKSRLEFKPLYSRSHVSQRLEWFWIFIDMKRRERTTAEHISISNAVTPCDRFRTPDYVFLRQFLMLLLHWCSSVTKPWFNWFSRFCRKLVNWLVSLYVGKFL